MFSVFLHTMFCFDCSVFFKGDSGEPGKPGPPGPSGIDGLPGSTGEKVFSEVQMSSL